MKIVEVCIFKGFEKHCEIQGYDVLQFYGVLVDFFKNFYDACNERVIYG